MYHYLGKLNGDLSTTVSVYPKYYYYLLIILIIVY